MLLLMCEVTCWGDGHETLNLGMMFTYSMGIVSYQCEFPIVRRFAQFAMLRCLTPPTSNQCLLKCLP